MTFFASLVLFAFVIFSYSKTTRGANNDPIVDTLSGKVQGSVDKSITGDSYIAFRGIPYATPPVGELRFEDPKPIKPWTGVRDAKEYGRTCTNVYVYNETRGTGEDCLFVNVFTRGSSVPRQKRPVMVWIYGGGWMFGDGDDIMYGPDYLMRKDIVLVTFNYRLGVIGFLNLEDEIAPGNQGLQDQVLALKWVRNNIAKFGGDPDHVTIFGESSGGMSVHLLALSPATKGLFHKVIIESGNVFDHAIDIVNPKSFAYKMCEMLGKNTRDHREIKAFLKTVDAKRLVEIQEKLYLKEDNITIMFPFGIAVDSKAKNPIIPQRIEKASLKGIQMPVLIGHNSNEALGLLNDIGNNLQKWNQHFEKYFSTTIVEYLKKYYNITLNDLKQLYFTNGQITKENRKNITDFFSDTYYVEGNHRTIKIQLEKSNKPTYYYVYTYDKTLSASKKLSKITEKGAEHTDELENLFRQKLYESLNIPALQRGTDPYKLMEQMTEMWVNFATTGNPTPITSELLPTKWLPVSNKCHLRYLNIGENLRMETTLSLVDRYSKLNPSSCSDQ